MCELNKLIRFFIISSKGLKGLPGDKGAKGIRGPVE